MKVLHVNLTLGGIGRYGWLLGRALYDTPGITARSVFQEGAPVELFVGDAVGYDYVTIPFAGTRRVSGLAALYRMVSEFRPDVVVDTAGTGYVPGTAVWALVRSLGLPLGLTVHDPVFHVGMGRAWSLRAAHQAMLRLGSHFFVHGPMGVRHLVSQGAPPDRVTAVRHGHLGVFADLGRDEVERDPRLVLCFGIMRPNKGLELLVPVADALRERYPDVRFLVAGNPKSSRELERSGWPARLAEVLDEMRARPYFEVVDRYLPDDEVAGLFHRAGVTVLPYLSATQSGVAMIAMPLGSAVVASARGDLPSVVADGETGVLVEPAVDDLVRGISSLFEAPERHRLLAARAREFALTECAWERTAGAVAEAMSKALDTSSA